MGRRYHGFKLATRSVANRPLQLLLIVYVLNEIGNCFFDILHGTVFPYMKSEIKIDFPVLCATARHLVFALTTLSDWMVFRSEVGNLCCL
jgi:hypothetical protein